MFEDKLALLEGAELCRSTASGMAAIATALTGLVQAGDHVLSGRALFGSCRWILDKHLPRFRGGDHPASPGRTSTPGAPPSAPTPRSCSSKPPPTRCWRSPTSRRSPRSPTPSAPRWWWTTSSPPPLYQQPLKLGADVVVYSATKHIDGGGRVLGGAILGKQALLDEAYKDFLRHTGPALSPFNAWVLLKGMETLELRVNRQTQTAAALADRVAEHKAVKRVFYPHRADHPQYAVAKKQMSAGSTLLAFDLGSQAGGVQLPQRVADRGHLQQPRRRQVDGHPPHHHHPPFHERGGPAGGRRHGGLRAPVGRGSWVVGRGSWVVGRGSWVAGRGLRVACSPGRGDRKVAPGATRGIRQVEFEPRQG